MNLTVSLQSRYGPLIRPSYDFLMRLIATLAGLLTLVVLLLPIHP